MALLRSLGVTVEEFFLVAADRSFYAFELAHAVEGVSTMEGERRKISAFQFALHCFYF